MQIKFHYIPSKLQDDIKAKGRKKPYRFNAAADVILLKEVVVEEPYSAPHGEASKRWDAVVTNIGNLYSPETARKRFSALLVEFKKQDAAQIRR